MCVKLGSGLHVTAQTFVLYQVREEESEERKGFAIRRSVCSSVRFMLSRYVELSSLVCGETLDLLHSELFKIHMMQKVM